MTIRRMSKDGTFMMVPDSSISDNPSSAMQRVHLMPAIGLLYLLFACVGAWQVIGHSNEAARYLKEACDKISVQNEAVQFLAPYTIQHPLAIPTLERQLKLPSLRASSGEIASVHQLIQIGKQESAIARLWTWFFLSASVVYIGIVAAVNRAFRVRPALFALTSVSVFLFVVGITAPAIALVTIPSVPIASKTLTFVLQCDVRSLSSVIVNLFLSGWWAVATLITTFGIATPLTKISLTLFAITTRFSPIRGKVARFLHAIGKWSMADVFVAAVFLGVFAIKNQQATKAFPCIGLYYFAGYCLLSMVTTVLLSGSQFVKETESQVNEGCDLPRRLEFAAVGCLLCVALVLVVVSVIRQYEQSTVTTPVQEVSIPTSATAPKPKRHQYTGDVVSIDVNVGIVIVKKAGAESKTFRIGSKTLCTNPDKSLNAPLTDINVGDKVTVLYTDDESVLTAHKISILASTRF